jgi:hypothetical protein
VNALFPPRNLLAVVLRGGTGGHLALQGLGEIPADASKDYLIHCKGLFCIGGKGANIKWVTEKNGEEEDEGDFIT